jgi:TolB-like protein/tetratricopeptide (TPR) repeat protein
MRLGTDKKRTTSPRARRDSICGVKSGITDPHGVGASSELIHREMEKVIASRTFRTAAAQRSFLRYVVTETISGRADQLKEYSIGVAVFQKKEVFDPRLDSIVRTEAHKLRARLDKYYELEGKEDALQIEIPVGKYAPIFKHATDRVPCTEPDLSADQVKPAEVKEVTVTHRVHAGIDRFEDSGLLFSAGFYPLESFPEQVLEPRLETSNQRTARIAVLPFMNRSESISDEFFSDGLTDELTHALTRVPGLEVVARTSAFQFKGQIVDVRDIGRRLNVDALIEGSVRRSQNRLRILVQLDDAHKGRAIWSQSYDRAVVDLFAVPQEIADTVTGELAAHFHGSPSQQLEQRSGGPAPVRLNPTAYEHYLRGQEFWNRHTIQDFESAAACFQKAIKRDSAYARAYSSLACCYVMMPILKATLPAEFIPRVEAAAARALRLDCFNGEAHIAMALPRIYEYDWAAAGAEFRQGLELCPSSVIGHAWYGTYLVSIGRGEEGLEQQRKVLDLDPISVPALFSYALTLYTLRRYDDAIGHFRKALSLNPSFPREHAGLGLACVRNNSFTRGIAELELAQAFTKGLGRVKANLAYAYAVAGYRGKAVDILNEFLSDFDPRRFPAAMIAEVYIGLGDKEKAFEWLHKAIDQKDMTVFLKADPLYDPLRTDPRFTNLLKRMNLA